MAKRFTESDKWKDVWFRRLPPEHKILWIYLIDQCDIAGFVEGDLDLIAFYTGVTIEKKEFLEVFAGRIVETSDGYFFIVKFIELQQNRTIDELDPHNNAHKSILKSLLKHNMKDSIRTPTEPSGVSPETPSTGNGKGNGTSTGKGKAEKLETVEIPEKLNTPEFIAAWSNFKKMRSEIKRPLRPTAERTQFKKLSDVDVGTAILMVEQSTANQWQGIFELKNGVLSERITRHNASNGTSNGRTVSSTPSKYSEASKRRSETVNNQ